VTQRMITPARPVHPGYFTERLSLRRLHTNLFGADNRLALAYVRAPPVGQTGEVKQTALRVRV